MQEEPDKRITSARIDRHDTRYNVARNQTFSAITQDKQMLFCIASMGLTDSLAHENHIIGGSGLELFSTIDFLEFANRNINALDESVPIYPWIQDGITMGHNANRYTASRVGSFPNPQLKHLAESMVHMRQFYDRIFDSVYQEMNGLKTPDEAMELRVVLAKGMHDKYPSIDEVEWLCEAKAAESHAFEAIDNERQHPIHQQREDRGII